jgi:hypothetical protein
MEVAQRPAGRERTRASVWELVGALVGSLLVLPVAIFAAVLGASTSDEWPVAVVVAFLIGFPLVAWGAVVVVLVRYWLGAWRRLWSLPLVVFVGFLFWPLLFFLISSRIRRSVLPYRPEPESPPA